MSASEDIVPQFIHEAICRLSACKAVSEFKWNQEIACCAAASAVVLLIHHFIFCAYHQNVLSIDWFRIIHSKPHTMTLVFVSLTFLEFKVLVLENQSFNNSAHVHEQIGSL